MRQAEVAKGAAWMALFTFVNRVILPIVGLVIAGWIGPAGLGIYAALNSLSVLIDLFREAGLSLTYVADQDRSRQRECVYSGLGVIMGVVGASAMAAASGWFARALNEPGAAGWIMLLAGSMLFTSFTLVPTNRLVKDGRFRDSGLIDTGANILSYIVALILVSRGWGYEALVVQMVSRSLLFGTTCSLLSRPIFGAFTWSDAMSVMRISYANMASNIAYTIYTMGDYLLITKFFGKVANGNYAAAYNVANKPVDLISGPVLRTAFVALSRSRDDKERLGRGFARILAVTILTCVPLYALLFFHADGAVLLLYRNKFTETPHLLQILILYLGCRAIGVVGASSLVAAGRPKWNAITWVPGYLVAGTGLWVAINARSLEGAVWALTVGAVLVYVLNLAAALVILEPSKQDLKSVWTALRVAVVTIPFAAAIVHLPLHPIMRFVVAGGIVTGVWAWMTGKTYLGDARKMLSKAGLKELMDRI